MALISISKKILSEKDLIVVPRKEYERLLSLQKLAGKQLEEINDTDEAVAIYRKEKRIGRLKTLKSLSRIR